MLNNFGLLSFCKPSLIPNCRITRMNLILLKDSNEPHFFSKNDIRAKHIFKVLKLKEGDTFRAGIVNQMIYDCAITRITSEGVFFALQNPKPPPPASNIILLCGLSRPNTMKRVFRESAALGVKHIYLLPTELGEKSYVSSQVLDPSKYIPLLMEGASQSYSTILPEITLLNQFSELTKHTFESVPYKYFFHKDDNYPAAFQQAGQMKTQDDQNILVAIGSERGWTFKEIQMFESNGFEGLRLFSRIVRTDSAFIAAISVFLSAQESRLTN